MAACAVLLALGLTGPAGAGAHESPGPPTAASLHRSTAALLRVPAYRATPERLLDGDPGVGDPTDPSGGSLDETPVIPENRVVTLYGAPQLPATALGKRTPGAAGRMIARQVRPYARLSDRPAIPALDLIAVIATASGGRDGLYRSRQPDELIAAYLRRARRIGGRLVLDVQPGRAHLLDEVRALEPWLEQPDVDIAIDPEWDVGPRGVPGRSRGSTNAKELNRVSRLLQRIVDRNELPPKLMVVHQFASRSIHGRGRIRQRPGVAATLNFDGIGTPTAKRAGYVNLSRKGLFNGFSLFYDLDSRVMSPRSVLGLDPAPDFLLYQ